MRPRHWLFGLLVIVMVGLALAGGKSGQTAFAQQNRQQSDNGRFQISAWARGEGPQARSGCYMVDTATGDLWETMVESNATQWVRVASGPHR
jgi:hypothetical protein